MYPPAVDVGTPARRKQSGILVPEMMGGKGGVRPRRKQASNIEAKPQAQVQVQQSLACPWEQRRANTVYVIS